MRNSNIQQRMTIVSQIRDKKKKKKKIPPRYELTYFRKF